MKFLCLLIVPFFLLQFAFAQTDEAQSAVEKTCMNYLEGFYEGDTMKIKSCFKASTYKIGFWKNKETGSYHSEGQMTYREAVNYARSVGEKKRFPPESAPKKVEVLDVMNHIASAKVTAWWGTDYILLSKTEEGWVIEQVLWEGPLEK